MWGWIVNRPWKFSFIPLWNFILWAIRPLNYRLSKVHWPLRINRKIKSEFYYEFRKQAQVGDVVLTYTRGELSNFYNPSCDFKHAFMVVHPGNELYLEAVGEGTRLRKFADIVEHYDRVAVYRPTFLRDAHQFRIAQHYGQYVGLDYDFYFEDEDYLKNGHKMAVYCYELIVSMFQNLCEIDRGFIRKEVVKDKKIYGPFTFIEDPGFLKVLDSGSL